MTSDTTHSALLVAIQTRNASLLTHLIAQGVDLSIRPLAPRWMGRFLHIEWATLLDLEEGVEALIQAGFDPWPTMALNTASSKGNLRMMTMLLDANSDPNQIHDRPRGVTGSSLHEAAEKGHFDAVLFLEHRSRSLVGEFSRENCTGDYAGMPGRHLSRGYAGGCL